MALMVLPVCLVPTLKEGSGAAFAGCLGTIIFFHRRSSGHPRHARPSGRAIPGAQVFSSGWCVWQPVARVRRRYRDPGPAASAQRPHPHAPRGRRHRCVRVVPVPGAR
ncbi:hypothetical protein PF003_g11787 [Phytophthora fragariae]|nr:hypothetical protein PF003_g11787 [Phytophthora fragariae]